MIPKKQSHNRRGFTLIELMVVVSVIAVLSTVGLVTYTNAQKNSRDAKRKADLGQIQSALELYYNINGRYPKTPDDGGGFGNSWNGSTDSDPDQWWITDNGGTGIKLNETYINLMPKDPINDGSKPLVYIYKSNSSWAGCPQSGKWYALGAWLENSSDPRTSANNQTKWCDGTSLITTLKPSAANVDFIIATN